MAQERWNDRKIELLVARFLRTGVVIASLLVLAGGIPYLIKNGTGVPEYRVFSGEPTDLRSVQGITAEFLSFRSRGVIQLGLLVLMLTPITWVFFLFLAFMKERDRVYTLVTAIVLFILLFSFAGRYL